MASKKLVSERLGSFSEDEARAISDTLNRVEAIKATVRQLMVGERNDQPTEWWLVEVPARSMLSASGWLRGWKAGKVHHQIERHREGRGGTYADAAHSFGYLEIMPTDPPVESNER